MIGSIIREIKGGCNLVKLERSVLNQSISCRTSQGLEYTNVHFGSCREAGGLWMGWYLVPGAN